MVKKLISILFGNLSIYRVLIDVFKRKDPRALRLGDIILITSYDNTIKGKVLGLSHAGIIVEPVDIPNEAKKAFGETYKADLVYSVYPWSNIKALSKLERNEGYN